MAVKELTWDETEKVGVALCKQHPEVDPDALPSQDVQRLARQLEGFKDDPAAFNEGKLEAIRTAWAMEFLDRTQ